MLGHDGDVAIVRASDGEEFLIPQSEFRLAVSKGLVRDGYDWHVETDRSDFYGTVSTVLDRFRDAGISVEIDEIDCTRRLYGASAGRVGMMLWLMDGAAAELGADAVLTIDQIRAAADRRLQKSRTAEFFAPEPPSDRDLFRAYLEILEEAGLKFMPRGGRDLEAML